MTYDVVIGRRTAKLVISTNDGKEEFQYTREGGENTAKTYSIQPAGESRYSVLVEGGSYDVTVAPNGEVHVNGRTLNIQVLDPRKLRGRGAAELGEGRITVAASMPGRVIRVLVEIGQTVEAGQGLIVVEAMKMQNEMKSPKAGRVLEIKTEAGAAVIAGEALIAIE